MNLFRRGKKEQQEPSVLNHMMEQLGYPYQILDDSLSLTEVMECYKKAVDRGKKEGFIPVLVPEDDVLDEYFGILKEEDRYDVQEALQKMGNHGGEFLQQKLKEFTDPEDDDLEALDLDEMMGEMENGGSLDDFYSLQDFKGKRKTTALVEVPAQAPWEVVVYVPFGGWNDCPAPEDMGAVCKYWYEKYGAVPAVITHDTLEFLLPNSISGDEAIEVAKEHFAFCTDRVDQCTESGTIGEVADSLSQSTVWYFWWD